MCLSLSTQVTLTRAVVTLMLLGAGSATAAAQSVILVRHAERADMAAGGSPNMAADPDLSAEGRRRADRLAAMLQQADIRAIFVTQYRRTQQTAAPLAAALGLTPTVVRAEDQAALLAQVRAVKGHMLVVGHSNTVPAITAELSGTPPVAIADDDFGNLWIVTTTGTPGVLRLRY
jgi:phosphohistidine phosphatase SixA